MRKFRFLALLLFLNISILYAHPGIGLVYDGDHSIYYSDLVHIWQLDIHTMEKKIVLENLHSHELFIDQEGNLYGEHYWYIEAEEKFMNYIWKLSPEGSFQKIREEKEGENKDFSFVRDDNFTAYFIRKGEHSHQIIKKTVEEEKPLHTLKLSHPTWSHVTEKGEFLFADFPRIYLANEETVRILVEDFSDTRFPFSLQSDEHSIYGIWSDTKGNFYVALYGGREVKKIDPKGQISDLVKSSFFWSPVNGIFDKSGNLWLMEAKLGGKIRVREIKQEYLLSQASFRKENTLISLGFLTFFGLIMLVVKRKTTANS